MTKNDQDWRVQAILGKWKEKYRLKIESIDLRQLTETKRKLDDRYQSEVEHLQESSKIHDEFLFLFDYAKKALPSSQKKMLNERRRGMKGIGDGNWIER